MYYGPLRPQWTVRAVLISFSTTEEHMVTKSKHRYAAAAAVGIAGLLTFATACGGQDSGSISPKIALSPSPSISEAGPTGPSITGGKVIKTDNGEYLQSTIFPDDPTMKYDPSKNLGTPEYNISPERIQIAQEFALRFVAEEVIDSPLNNSATSVDAWWNEHKNLFDPAYHDSIRSDFDSGSDDDEGGPVTRNLWQKDVESFDYKYVYSPNETRFSEREMDVTEIYYSDKDMLVITIAYSYTAKVQTPEGVEPEKANGTYQMGLVPTGQNGSGWAISHYNTKWTVVEIPALANQEK